MINMKKAFCVLLILAVLVSAFAITASAAEESSADVPQSSAEASIESAETSAESADTSSDGVINFTFSTSRFPTALKHMAVGMLGVLIVLGLIAVVVFILNGVSRPKK